MFGMINLINVACTNNLFMKMKNSRWDRTNNSKIKARSNYTYEYSNYSAFVDKITRNKINEVVIVPTKNGVKYVSDEDVRGFSRLIMNDRLLERMEEHNVNISYDFQDQSVMAGLFNFIPFIFPLVLLYSIIQNRQNQTGGGGGGMMNPFGGGSNKFEFIENTNVKFKDVAGIDEAKNEIMELVEFLKSPQKFMDAGAVIPKGCLLSGPPGTGKTLMAKAIAGEAGVPFIACSASQFIELFVGIGASRIRELFKKARGSSPCIIFIDEIDAIGKSRGSSINTNGGNDEREQTLNQLLTEMDGFNENDGIIVLAATNREDVLDKALLRPGRFDRKITISLPSYEGRIKILKIHSEKKQVQDEGALIDLAKKTIGCSGAELMNIMNEASIFAARNDRRIIVKNDLEEAFDKITIGLPKEKFISHKTIRIVAYHEAGHAILGALLQNFDKVSKVSILPRGNSGGVTQFIPDEAMINNGMYSREYLSNKIIVGLGGRIAEELIFGEKETTTGAVNDIQVVTSIAKTMVEKYGFSKDLGLLDISDIKNVSDDTRKKIDNEVAKIITDSYETAKTLIEDRIDVLTLIADTLMKEETIDGDKIYELLELELN